MTQFDGRTWDTLGERGNLLANEGWRYIEKGHVRHLCKMNLLDDTLYAWCGIPIFHIEWYGTGTQEEYERLASLPKCLNCMRSYNRPVRASDYRYKEEK